MFAATELDVSNEPLAQEFEQLFHDHYPMVYRTAYSVTGSRQDAEDVLQTIFLRLLQRDIPLELRTGPKAYLYRAAVNLSLNMVRSRKRQNVGGDVERLEAPARAAGPEPADEI